MPGCDPGATQAGHRLVLITGATGMIGPRIVERFAATGFRVRVLVRRSLERPLAAADIDVKIGEVSDPVAARAAVDGVDAVVHMAARLHVTGDAGLDREAYQRTNVEGTREMVTASLNGGVRRFVLFSTIAVYGGGKGDVWDEDFPIRPELPYGMTKVEAERLVLSARRGDGTPLGVVLRLGAVFGPGLKGNYLRLVQALASGRFVPLGPGLNRRALINDTDVASATVLAATHPAAAGRIYNVADGHDHTLAEIIEAICRALGRRPPRFRVPLAPARIAIGIVEAVARLVRISPPISRASLEKYTEDIRVDVRRIREELGFVPQCELEEGWREAVAAMRDSGRV